MLTDINILAWKSVQSLTKGKGFPSFFLNLKNKQKKTDKGLSKL